jgi:uncharacterized membrane protein
VLFALGAVMLFWALAGRLATPLVAGISVTALLATQWLTPGPEAFGVDYPVWVRMLQIPGRSGPVVVFYPVIPWLGVAGLGIVIGRWRSHWEGNLSHAAFAVAAILGAAFLVVRSAGGFGNLHVPTAGWIGFLNVTKYPPSLAFVLLTLGLNALILGILSAGTRQGCPWLTVFGRTPLFFYILHLYVFGLMGWAVPAGVSLGWMLVYWLVGLAVLYPACRFYDRFKSATRVGSLWHFL